MAKGGDDVTLFQRAGGAAECGAPDLGDRGEGRLAGPSAQSMTRAPPTRRGRTRCGLLRFGAARGQTAASPRAGACRLRCVGRRCLALRGKGRCGVRRRRCLPLRGKGAAVWARLILVGLWEKLFAGGFALQKGRQARRGGAVSCGGVRSTKPPSFRRRPAGRTAGSARTRLRDQSLRYPFLGNGAAVFRFSGGAIDPYITCRIMHFKYFVSGAAGRMGWS